MARLIDAEALMEELKGFRNESKVAYRALLTKLIYFVAAMPPVDAQPVVHGEWINVRRFHDDCYKADCSNCLETTIMDWGIPRADYKHCRYCGAKMDGGAK